MKIVSDNRIPYIHDYFSPYGELVLKPGREINPTDVADADILIVRSITSVDETLLKGSTVKFVGSLTAGADHLDKAWLKQKSIAFSVAEGFNALAVSDYVVSVIAALSKQGILNKKTKKAAVIGVGHIGKLVAERLAFLNFDVSLCDPLRALNEKNFISCPLSQIEEMDVITLHVPLTYEGTHRTHHLIDKSFLSRQKKGTVLLNASRGAVLHTEDFLTHGKHLYGCFDVWEHEPHIHQGILDQAVIATPHIAGYSLQSKIRGIAKLYECACEQGIITPLPVVPVQMPVQTLNFQTAMSWEKIVLSIFDPLLSTSQLKSRKVLFDTMRNEFNHRYELAYTKINEHEILSSDQALVQKLGLICI